MQELSDGCGEARRRHLEDKLLTSIQERMQEAKEEEVSGRRLQIMMSRFSRGYLVNKMKVQ